MKKANRFILTIASGLFMMLKFVWVSSLSAIVLIGDFVALPKIMELIEAHHEKFNPYGANLFERIGEDFFYHYGAIWFMVTMLVLAIFIYFKGVMWLKGKSAVK